MSLQIEGAPEHDFSSRDSRIASREVELRIRNRRYVSSDTPVRVNVLVVPSALIPPAGHHKTEPPSPERDNRRKSKRTSRVKVATVVAISGTGSPATIERRIRSHYRSGIEQCHEQLLEKDPKASGKVTVRFSVGPVGNVTKSTVNAFDSTVAGCIRGITKTWRFGKDSGSHDYALALKLKPDR